MRADDEFLACYMQEVGHLREAGAAFAKLHPQVAAGLDISHQRGDDPQIDRLVESFAFLTAKLQQQYQAQFPEIPAALLQALFPQLVAPVPSMAIAEFEVDPDQAALAAAGLQVPRGTMLFSTAGVDVECRFQTSYPLQLWPIKVSAVKAERPADVEPGSASHLLDRMPEVELCLRVSLECTGPKINFGSLSPTSLRFYIDGDSVTRFRLYELLCNNLLKIAVATFGDEPDAQRVTLLTGARIRAIGLGPDEAMLPYPTTAHDGYRLVQEYFSFPDKFMFVEVEGLAPGVLGTAVHADLLFLLGDGHADDLRVNANTLRLGCVPMINLFLRTSEPIRLDHLTVEYPLSPDTRFATTTEVHTVLGISRSATVHGPQDVLQPFFSATPDFGTADGAAPGRVRWLARRQKASNPTLSGSEMMLSFVDPEMRPEQPADDVVFAQLLCTNRALARQLSPRAKLSIEADLPIRRISCLSKPTAPIDSPFSGEHLWRLVSHLTLNKLSLQTGQLGLQALRQILALYAGANDRARKIDQIEGIDALSTRPEVGCYGEKQWRGFVRGTEVTMVFEERKFVGGGAFLLASVLERFVALYAGVNSFTRLLIKRKGEDEVWKRWPARAGDRFVL